MSGDDLPARPTNLGSRGIRSRAWTGIVALVVAVCMFAFLRGTESHRAWRLLLALPLGLAALGLLQARAGT